MVILKPCLNKKTKFKVGDSVWISKLKKTFEKGFEPNWTEEIFVVHKVQNTQPITYKIKDLNDEPIVGSFYEQQLQATDQKVFRIDKIIRRNYKTKQALVRWRGYDKSFDSWIPFKDIDVL